MRRVQHPSRQQGQSIMPIRFDNVAYNTMISLGGRMQYNSYNQNSATRYPHEVPWPYKSIKIKNKSRDWKRQDNPATKQMQEQA